MKWWTRFSFVLVFFRDMFFDKKEETKFTSISFNTRKFTIFMMCLCSFALNSYLINRVFAMVPRIQELEKATKYHESWQGEPVLQLLLPSGGIVIPYRDMAVPVPKTKSDKHEGKKH